MKNIDELRAIPGLHIHAEGWDGFNGYLKIFGQTYSVVCSWGGDWDHVSISCLKETHTPSWHEMCKLKEMFFCPDEMVVQYHPAEQDYVDFQSNCLHLWKPRKETLPKPPTRFV